VTRLAEFKAESHEVMRLSQPICHIVGKRSVLLLVGADEHRKPLFLGFDNADWHAITRPCDHTPFLRRIREQGFECLSPRSGFMSLE
jgi:hypothetical protein